MNTLRINKMVALLCAACCVLASMSNTSFGQYYAVPEPLYVLQATLEPVQNMVSPGHGKARFVAFTDKVNCSFDTFLRDVEPGSVMVVSIRREKVRQPVCWVTADKGRAVVELSTLRGDLIPMCRVGDVVEIWTVTQGPYDPTSRPVPPPAYNLILQGVLE